MRLMPLIFCDQFDLDGHQCAAVRVHLKADFLPVLDSSVDEVRQVAWIGQSMAFIGSVIVGELGRLRLRWAMGFPWSWITMGWSEVRRVEHLCV